MKNLQSKTEGVWKEVKSVSLTDEEKTLLMSTDEADLEARKTLADNIKARRFVDAKPEDSELAQTKYDSVKPTLEQEDKYQLISFDATLDSEQLTGILNCRVNGEHKQIRF